MAQYEVLRPVEYDDKLYLPSGADAPETAKSSSNGRDIPTDVSGIINLDAKLAASLDLGQIKLIPAKKKTGQFTKDS